MRRIGGSFSTTMSRAGVAAVTVRSVMAHLLEHVFYGQGVVGDRLRDQTLEGRTVATSKVGDVAAVDAEEHLGRGVAELSCDPLRRLTRSQPERRGRMAALVGPALLQAQMTQERIPDPVGDVLVGERQTKPVGEDVLAQLPRRLVLRAQRVEHDLTHLDVALAAVRLRVLLVPRDDG